MKNIIFTLIFLMICSLNIYSQWTAQNSGVSGNINNVFFANENTGFFSIGNKVYKSTNSGTNWNLVYTFVSSYNFFIYTIWFTNENTGWVGGFWSIIPPYSSIYVTYNGGVNWTLQTNIPSSYILDIKFINQNTGFAFGSQMPVATSLVLKTVNGGSTWNTSNPFGAYHSINKSSFINENTGWVITDDNAYGNDYVYKTNNSAVNWYQVGSFLNLKSIYFFNANTGWIGGYSGIYKTTNGASNWVNQYSGPDSITALTFINDSFGWAIGKTGKMKYTYNGGTNWAVYSNITNNNLNSIYFLSTGKGWISGSGGTILYTSNNGGITGLNKSGNILPKSFSLSQNYPNPFNPSTTIKFSLPNPSKGGTWKVDIIIYDMLGREVERLIPPLGGGHEGLKPGSYEVQWDGSRFASGVYFYKLITDEFTETKKMVLMK